MTKSKDDILKEEYEKVFSLQRYGNRVNLKMDEMWVKPAMDEYAKSQSIAFAEWIRRNYESSSRPNIWYGFAKGTTEINSENTTDQLYQLFLDSSKQ